MIFAGPPVAGCTVMLLGPPLIGMLNVHVLVNSCVPSMLLSKSPHKVGEARTGWTYAVPISSRNTFSVGVSVPAYGVRYRRGLSSQGRGTNPDQLLWEGTFR